MKLLFKRPDGSFVAEGSTDRSLTVILAIEGEQVGFA